MSLRSFFCTISSLSLPRTSSLTSLLIILSSCSFFSTKKKKTDLPTQILISAKPALSSQKLDYTPAKLPTIALTVRRSSLAKNISQTISGENSFFFLYVVSYPDTTTRRSHRSSFPLTFTDRDRYSLSLDFECCSVSL